MKHLLIILSFLLLSSPVIGQETGVLYQYETSGGKKWKTFGDGKVQPKYKGEIKNGIMDGLGVLTYQYETSSGIQWKTFGDGKVQPKYNGEIKNGIMDGLGVLTYPYDEKNIVG